MNRFGYISGEGYAFTYQIGETPVGSAADIYGSTERRLPLKAMTAQRVNKYFIWPFGDDNLEPNTCKALIKGNRLLPSLIEKQVSILYGNGPQLYVSRTTPDGTLSRQYINNEEIQTWLDSWRENGLPDSYQTYLNKCIRSYYYSEGVFTKWHISRGYRTGLSGFLPVAGLEHVDELRCRMATTRNISMNNVISYSKNPNYGESIYASNVFFNGIKEWIKGCNATPEYINSFLENSLSARHHVIIPNGWIKVKEDELQQLCDINARLEAEGKPQSEFAKIRIGSKEIEVGTLYRSDLLNELIQAEMTNLTNFLAGRGKNQGKTYATRSVVNQDGNLEEWKIEEIPQKYKEYIEALISYDKRADMVLLSAKGIDSSISNISSDGVISKSGSDTYYNYLVYLTQQALPESIICADINYAIRQNFPEAYRSGIRLGFYRPTVKRQEDVSPAKRLSNQAEL